MRCAPRAVLLAALVAIPTACSVGPDYERPKVAAPTKWKSATADGAARPRLAPDWWKLFADRELDALEAEAIRANEDLKASVARVLEARALARVTSGQFFPAVSLDPSYQRARSSANRPSPGGFQAQAATTNDIKIPLDASYEVDVWGRIRRSYEAAEANVRASVDDRGVVLLTLESDLAQDFFTLRSLDAEDGIVARNVGSYRRQLELVKTLVKAGLSSPLDLAEAETQLHSTETQEIELRRQRADLEHAMAVLLGRPPVELTIPVRPLGVTAPAIPAGLPADLLRRRPDVAEAEEDLRSAVAGIGVAHANFYPVLKLTGSAGYESLDIQNMLNWESRIWSFGPSISYPVFEGGALEANLDYAKARADEMLAVYRGRILEAYREVEDALTDLHHRSDESRAEAQALASAREYRRLSELRYRRGLVSTLELIDADRTLLSNELLAAQITNARLVATVLLIKALGGGWAADAVAKEVLSEGAGVADK